jgi:hypothetical protein
MNKTRKPYNKEGGRESSNRDGYNREGRNNYNREGRDGEKRQYGEKKYIPRERKEVPKGGKSFEKNPNGFLVISLFVKSETPSKDTISSIESALAIDHKKKVVITFESQKNKQEIADIKKKFANAFVLFFTPKAKMGSNSTKNSSVVHSEVLHTFKSQLFLTLDANIKIREYSVEKMISFLCKDGDTCAVAPKFYNKAGDIIKNCKRFFSIWNFLPEVSNFIKNKNIEHVMMERGDVGYYSIHRVDYSSLDCMLFLTDQLIKIKSFNKSFNNQDLRDASVCRKFAKKTGGKIIFYPHSRVVINQENPKQSPTIAEKIKYFF